MFYKTLFCFYKRMGNKGRTKRNIFWDAKYVQITTANSEAVLILWLLPYSVKVYPLIL